jgi:hypothetical protein
MVLLRCTQKLLLRLRRFEEPPPVRSTTRLGEWYGDLLRMGRRHALLFISERSRLPILMPVAAADRLRKAFPDAVCEALAALGIPPGAIDRERAEMREIAIGPTENRSLRGSLADFGFLARGYFLTSRYETLDQIARRLAETPLIAPFKGERPDDVTRKLFGVD